MNIVIGTIIGLLMAGLSIIQTVLETAASLLKDFIKIVSDLLVAAFTIIKGLFTAIGTAISGIWNGIWDGLVATVKATWDVITSISKAAMEGLSKAFEDYAASQKLAARVFSQVSDVAENQGKTIKEGANQFREMGMALSEKFAVGLNDATMGLYRITSAGITASDSIKSIAETAGAMGVMSQHEDTFESLSNTLVKASQAYKISGSEISRFGAIISAATKMGSFDLKEYNAAIQSVIGSAAEAKVPFDQLNLILALTSHAGLNLNRVTVGMNRLFDALTNPTKANAEAIKDMGINVKALQASGMSLIDILVEMEDKVPTDKMRQMFGTVQGVRAFRAIKSQMGDMGEGTKRMTNMVRDFGKGIDEALGLAANRMIKTRNAWENFKTSMAGKLLDESFLAGMDILDEIISGLVNTVGKMDFSPITKALSGGMKDVWNTIKQLPAFIGQTLGISINWENVIKSVASYITQISNYLANPKTWEGLVKGTLHTANYLKTAYEYIKQMLTDVSLADRIFNSLGSAIKNIAVFLIETFKDAFEVAASYAQSTFLPVFKMMAKEFGGYLLSSLGDAFGSMGRGLTTLIEKIQPLYYDNGKPVYSPVDDMIVRSLESLGGIMGELSMAANAQSLSWKNPGRELTNQESIFNALKPILEDAIRSGNGGLISSLVSISGNQKLPGGIGKEYNNKSADQIGYFLSKIASSSSLDEAMKSANEGGAGIKNLDSYVILNKILFALTEKGKLNEVVASTDNPNLKALIESFGKSVAIEKEKDEGKYKFGNTDFLGRLETNFGKLQNSLNTTMSLMSGDMKRGNPEIWNNMLKTQENINKLQFQVAEANTKATIDNTNALNRKEEEKKKGRSAGGHEHDKLVPVSQVGAYIEKMRRTHPGARISESGVVRTGSGYKQMINVDTSNTNAVVKKSVEEQNKLTKEGSGTGAVVNEIAGVATLTKEVIKELKGLNRTFLATSRANGYSVEAPPRDNSFWNRISTFDIWEQI
jgi:TP901 family phage tail tape measure protein